MRTRIRTIALVACVLALLAVVEGIHGSAGAATPQATAAKTWSFSGKGSKKLGTFKLRRKATLRWRSSGRGLMIVDPRGFRLLSAKKRRGKLTVSRGTYRRLSVSARGRWRITIRERR